MKLTFKENSIGGIDILEVNKVITPGDIMNYLVGKGFRQANKGFEYAFEAIRGEIIGEYSDKVTVMYAQVAKNCNSTASRVERAIRHEIIHSGLGKAVGEFIAESVNYFKMVFPYNN